MTFLNTIFNMPIKANKQPKETSQGLVFRFTKKVKRSGVLLEARKRRFTKKPKSKQLKKRSALRRQVKKREYQEKKKLGKL